MSHAIYHDIDGSPVVYDSPGLDVSFYRQRQYVVCPSSDIQSKEVTYRAYRLLYSDWGNDRGLIPTKLAGYSDEYELVNKLVKPRKKNGETSDVYLVRNMPDGSDEDLGHYAFLHCVECGLEAYCEPLNDSDLITDELPFSISVD